MTNMEDIRRELASPVWSASEKWVIKWQFKLLGDFQTALAEAICRADDNNLVRLRQGFSVEVAGFILWTRSDLAQIFRATGLDI